MENLVLICLGDTLCIHISSDRSGIFNTFIKWRVKPVLYGQKGRFVTSAIDMSECNGQGKFKEAGR
jgi:hypothetical protein